MLNNKLITPFNKNYGSELRLSDFRLDDGNRIIVPRELASKVLYKKGGRLFTWENIDME